EMSFDEGWLFFRGDPPHARAPAFNDSSWRQLDVPHDWRIEDLPDPTSDDGGATSDPSAFAFITYPSPEGKPPARIGPFDVHGDPIKDGVASGGRTQGYTVGGVGWYRKHFTVPTASPADPEIGGGQQVELRFDGVYQNADVYLNGVHLGFHPNGYTAFSFDLTPHLLGDGVNVLAVRVDDKGETSRWYSGSGIYRHTQLVVTGPVRIPVWGVYVTTPVVSASRSVVYAE